MLAGAMEKPAGSSREKPMASEGLSSPKMSKGPHASFRFSELFLPTQQTPRYSPFGQTWNAESPTI